MTNDNIVIKPNDSVSKLAAVKRKMRISLSCVKLVSTALVPRSRIYKSIRLGRTALPPHFAGRFYSVGHGLIFCALSDREKCVMPRLHDFTYREVAVQVDDKENVAEMMRRSLTSQLQRLTLPQSFTARVSTK
ncbi:hypothetical protein [Nitrososphaera sp.]|uniref:hypothetical protein n=1 Tax=Nitrososphaera sp. TaxID=1971748 RepID=UPI002EDB0439